MHDEEVGQLMGFYPKIYFACHTRHVTDTDKNIKLTSNQASVLDHLDGEESITLYDLAMHMGVTPSTMTTTINRLEQSGYIQKVKDDRDGRKVNLTLTKAGEKIKLSKSVLDPERVGNILSRLTEVERKRAIDGLALLAYAAEMEMKSKSVGKAWTKRYKSKK